MSVITSAKQQFVTRLRTEVRDTLHVDHLLKLSSGLDRRIDRFDLESENYEYGVQLNVLYNIARFF